METTIEDLHACLGVFLPWGLGFLRCEAEKNGVVS